MYEAQLPSDWTYILNDSQCNTLFCATESIFRQVHKEVLPNTPSVESCLCLNGEGEGSFSAAMANVQEPASIMKPTKEDLATLIYTSGTTGRPKGVELTHENMAVNVSSAFQTLVGDSDLTFDSERSLAFLPWAHSYGQTCELWGMMSQGGSMGICRGIPHILEDLQNVKPTVLFGVPILYKRVFDGVHNVMETASPIRKTLMRRALTMGRRRVEADTGARGPLGLMERLQSGALDSLVLSKIRARFGGQLRHAFVAGAACPVEVIRFMDDIGIPLCEGYGLTETSPIVAINAPANRLPGSVGQCIEGVSVYIMNGGVEVATGEEGEICCVGPNVMKGYHNNPEATADVISVAPDGKSRM